MYSNDAEKTAFATPTISLSSFTIWPLQGSCHISEVNGMCTVLQLHTCLLYIDDVTVFSQDFDFHLERLTDVVNRICNAGLKLTPKKYHLFKKEVEFLGHIVYSDGVSMNHEKVHMSKNGLFQKIYLR